jgi:MazG family protein
VPESLPSLLYARKAQRRAAAINFEYPDVHGALEQAARLIHEKLVRRHALVFGDVEAETAGRVRSNWETIKREQEGRSGIFHDVPESLPSLLHARKAQRRAAAIDFEYPDVQGALADLDVELRELKEAIDAAGGEPPPETEPDPHVFEELGDVLFAAVNVARRVNVDPELALRAMSQRFRDRVERAEQRAAANGETFVELSLEQKDAYFDQAKEESR